eukprot:gene5037-7028_t
MRISELVVLLLLYVHWVYCKLFNLSPIKCIGSFRLLPSAITDSPKESKQVKKYPAVYLTKSNELEINENEDDSNNSIYVFNIIPLVLKDDPNNIFQYLLSSKSSSLLPQISSRTLAPSTLKNKIDKLVNLDNGVYDNLPYDWISKFAKKSFYDHLYSFKSIVNDNNDPFILFIKTLLHVLDAEITGLIIEIDDKYSNNRLTIGASIVIAKSSCTSDWKLSINENLLSISKSIKENDQNVRIINCHIDELIGFSCAMNMPICMESSLYDSLIIDGKIMKTNYNNDNSDKNDSNNDTGMSIIAPLKLSNSLKQKQNNVENDDIPLAWEIFDPNKFFSLSTIDKRNILRASGKTVLPRPREGIEMLDNMLLDLMDDAVRAEILRLQSIKNNNSNNNNNKNNNNSFYKIKTITNKMVRTTDKVGSSRQSLLESMAKALQNGNVEEAEELREDFMRLTSLKADPTQNEGSYDPYLDQDDWYMEQRRRAMMPKKPPSK